MSKRLKPWVWKEESWREPTVLWLQLSRDWRRRTTTFGNDSGTALWRILILDLLPAPVVHLIKTGRICQCRACSSIRHLLRPHSTRRTPSLFSAPHLSSFFSFSFGIFTYYSNLLSPFSYSFFCPDWQKKQDNVTSHFLLFLFLVLVVHFCIAIECNTNKKKMEETIWPTIKEPLFHLKESHFNFQWESFGFFLVYENWSWKGGKTRRRKVEGFLFRFILFSCCFCFSIVTCRLDFFCQLVSS